MSRCAQRDAVIDEALDELGRGDRPALARADVLHVGDRRIDQPVDRLRPSAAPQLVADCLAGGEQLLGELVVVGEQPAIFVAQADHHRAGQRGEIDHRSSACNCAATRSSRRHSTSRPSASVLITSTVWPDMRRDDVARPLGIAVGHILDQPADADDIRLGLALGERLHRADDRAGAAHVPLHGFHAGGGLDRDAAGVEGHALADEGDRRLAVLAAIPSQDEHPRLADRALGDAEQRAHAELGHRRAVEHLDFDARALRRFPARARRSSPGR